MSGSAALLDTQPNGAKAYDHLLRGDQDSVKALRPDRDLVARLKDLYPPGVPGPRDLAIASRVYLQRAVRDARQVLDLGAGYLFPPIGIRGTEPLRPLHAVAKDAHPEARCAYVDWDTLAAGHGCAAVQDVPGVTYTELDLAKVAAVRAHPDVAAVIDWRFPVTVVFGLVLHFYPAETAKTIINGYLDRMVPGSRVVVTVASWRDASLLEKVQAVYGPARLYSHSEMQVMALFRGMSLLGNGIKTARGPFEVVGDAPARVLAGVGLV